MRSHNTPIPLSLKIILVFIIGLLLFIQHMPWSIQLPHRQLDNSWQVMLGIAIQHHLQFGKSLIWTYGPLGFLNAPLFYPDHSLWLMAFLFTWILYFVFLFLLVWLNSESVLELLGIVLVTLLSINISTSTQLIFLALILLMYADHYTNYWRSILAGILLALASLIKVSHFFTAIILLEYPLLVGGIQQWKKWILGWFSYCACLLILWTITGQPYQNIPNFLSSSLSLIHGYGPAMTLVTASYLMTTLAWIILCILIFWSMKSFLYFSKKLSKFLILTLPVVFEYLKEGNTRADMPHLDIFFAFILWYILILYDFSKLNRIPSHSNFWFLIFVSLSCFTQIFWVNKSFGYYSYQAAYLPQNFKHALFTLSSSDHRQHLQEAIQQHLRQQFHIPPSMISKIGHASVNILPWELNLAYAYNLNLLPSPVIQAYSAYTPTLDRINAAQVNHDQSAQFILYKFISIDHRYPLYDEPSFWKTILYHYRLIQTNGHWALLEKRTHPAPHSACISIQTLWVHWNRLIQVPPFPHGYEFANIRLRYTWLGSLLNILDVVPPPMIGINADHAGWKYYRFVPAVGPDGCFMSDRISQLKQLKNVFHSSQPPAHPIQQLIFKSLATFEYQPKIKIQFYGYAHEL
jgi:hypothetical protein